MSSHMSRGFAWVQAVLAEVGAMSHIFTDSIKCRCTCTVDEAVGSTVHNQASFVNLPTGKEYYSQSGLSLGSLRMPGHHCKVHRL